MFANRVHAGRELAAELARYRGVPGGVVLGIPRGGVIVAAEVARALGLPLDVAVAAKVGAPGNPEYAIGAVTPDGEVTDNPASGYSKSEVDRLAGDARAKVTRYTTMLREGHPEPQLKDATVILVDDGLATGLTMRAAVEWLRRQKAGRIVVAVPVASVSAAESLRTMADELVALSVPVDFFGVGQFYADFAQTTDAQVLRELGPKGPETPNPPK